MSVIKTPKDDLMMSLMVADLNDDKTFKQIVTQIGSFLDAHHIAMLTGCTVSTVERWINGTAAPHPSMRKSTIDRLLNEIK